MKKLQFQCDIWVPAPIEEVWEFCSLPQNLAKISPPEDSIRVDFEGKTSEGSQVAIFIKPKFSPFEIKWLSVIQDVVDQGPTRQFVDVQTQGPFAYWKHQHLFESGDSEIHAPKYPTPVKVKNPGTWIKDRVTYAMPFGILGVLADQIFARKKLEAHFAYRASQLKKHFER